MSIIVETVDDVVRGCNAVAPSFQALLDGNPLADDALGFSYAAAALGGDDNWPSLTLPLSGHIVLGQSVQQGAGWTTTAAGILESGTLTLRVVPWGSDERITLDVERLDPGSLFDTHACLAPNAVKADKRSCPAGGDASAIGFLRLAPRGGLSVQLYAQGPVGVLPFGSTEQRTLKVPNSTAGWRSELVRVYGSFLILVAGLLGVLPKMKADIYDPIRAWYKGEQIGAEQTKDINRPRAPGLLDEAETQEMLASRDHSARGKTTSTAGMLLLAITLAGMIVALGASSVLAEPVEIRQGTSLGAGYSFHRGGACHVVTALHVVPEIGMPVTVIDRSGGKSDGNRSYKNEAYDLALITLLDKSSVACTSTWPDVAWLRHVTYPAASEFRVVRDYSSGKQVIVRLKYAGGDKDRLTLAPVDKLTVRESDSGSIVEFDGKLAGIVQSIDSGTDYVSVLKFDRIDELVGDRFRVNSDTRAVKFSGVLWHGRENPRWTSYAQAWITEKIGPVAYASLKTTGGAAPKFNCEVKVEVISWDRVAVPNPAYDSVQLQLKSCGKKGFLFEQMCNAARSASATTPRQIHSQKITLNATVIPASAAPMNKLVTTTHIPQSDKLSQAEIELGSLQAALGLTLPDLIKGGACD